MNTFKKLMNIIAGWLFTPPKAKQTYNGCRDRAEDEKEADKEQEKKTGGFAY
jgi:hypothetical protein